MDRNLKLKFRKVEKMLQKVRKRINILQDGTTTTNNGDGLRSYNCYPDWKDNLSKFSPKLCKFYEEMNRQCRLLESRPTSPSADSRANSLRPDFPDSSRVSTASSIPPSSSAASSPRSTSEDENEISKDSVYSEVASFISMNEQRPNFLIAIFSLLKFYNTDPLRQLALVVLGNVAGRGFGADATEKNGFARGDVNVCNDDEFVRRTPSRKEDYLKQRNSVTRSSAEVSNISDMPSSSSVTSLEENPFCRDTLQETAIYLEEAFRKMKENSKLEEIHTWLSETSQGSLGKVVTDKLIAEILTRVSRVMELDIDKLEQLYGELKEFSGKKLSSVHNNLIGLMIRSCTERSTFDGVAKSRRVASNSSRERDDGNYETGRMKSMQLSLALSETKPYSRIGSDEDANDETEKECSADPCETAVSLVNDGQFHNN